MSPIVNIHPKDFNTTLPLTIAGGWTNFFSYVVAPKEVFKMTHFANYMATADWANVAWRITKNGIPIAPYDYILDQIGISTLPRTIEPIYARGGDEIRIDGTLLATATVDPNDIGIAAKYEVM